MGVYNMEKDGKGTIIDGPIELSEDYKERTTRLFPIAKDFLVNKCPNDVLEYTAGTNPKDAYILGWKTTC